MVTARLLIPARDSGFPAGMTRNTTAWLSLPWIPVGVDAADPGGGQVDLVDGLGGEEVIDRRLVEEVQFGVAGW